MPPVLFDSSVYIAALRADADAVLALRREVPDQPVWLSAVVLEELYAGADAGGTKVIERLERDFVRLNRILVPLAADWALAGKLLSNVGRKYGHEEIGRTRLTNDALIAVSAARNGTTVLTANAKDFELLARFRRFQWQLWRPNTPES